MTQTTPGQPLARGARLPDIVAEGWLNGPPSQDELAGKVLVIDVWGPWCGPCRQAAPHLVEVERKYSPRGVRFLGLTPDGAENLDAVREFVTRYEISWPNGYGAQETVHALQVSLLPTLFVIGADGKIFWNSFDSRGDSLEVALEQALSRAPKQ